MDVKHIKIWKKIMESIRAEQQKRKRNEDRLRGLLIKIKQINIHIKGVSKGGTWVAQVVEHPTLDFSSGHDLRVVGLSPMSGSMLSVKSA